MAQDAPYQNSDQVGLAVRDIFYPLHVVFIHWFASRGRDCLDSLDWFCLGLREALLKAWSVETRRTS